MENKDSKQEPKSFKEKLESLPHDFLLVGEEYKELHFKNTIDLINDLLSVNGKNILDQLNEEERNGFMTLFNFIHAWGFYAGIDYTLDPVEKYDMMHEE